jgi:hypothetical protein
MVHNASKLKRFHEIQAAHDRLVAILVGELPNPFTDDQQQFLNVATDVLCWVLSHEHNTGFQANLDKIESFLQSCKDFDHEQAN